MRLNEGDLAYVDSFAGLVPCKVISLDWHARTAEVRITADRGAYKKGETYTGHTNRVVNRAHVVRRSGQYRIAQGF